MAWLLILPEAFDHLPPQDLLGKTSEVQAGGIVPPLVFLRYPHHTKQETKSQIEIKFTFIMGDKSQ